MRRRIAIALLLLVAVPLAAVLGAFAWVQTPPGKRQLAGLVEDLATSPGMAVRIGGIDGTVPFDMTLTDVAIADDDGVWLTIDRAGIDWAPLALFDRVLHVRRLGAGTVHVMRPPAPSETAAPEPEPAPRERLLPDLPVAIQLDRLDIDTIALDAPVLGEAVRLTVEGEARLADPSDGLTAHLAARRVDGADGNVTLDLGFVPETGALSVTAAIDEAAGGIIARAADLPGLPPVTARLVGDGTLDDWQATLDADAGDLLSADAEARIRATDAGRRLTVEMEAALAPLLPPDLAPLVADGATLSAAVILPSDGPLRVEAATLESAAGTVAVDGTLDLGDEIADLDYRIEAGAPDAFRGLLPDAAWQQLAATGRLTGALAHPAATMTLTGRAVAAGGVAFDTIEASLRADPSGPFGAADTTIAFATEGAVRGLVVGDEGVDALTRSTIAWVAEGAFTGDGDVAIDRLAVTLPSGELTAEGTLAGWGRGGADLEAHVAVPNLAELQGLVGRPVTGSLALDAAVTSDGRAAGATVDGTLTDVTTGIPQVDGLLGARTTLVAQLRRLPDGRVEVAALDLDGAAIDAEAAGMIGDERTALDWSVRLPDLSAVDPALAGAVAATGSLSGPLTDLAAEADVEATDVVAAGRSIPQARLTLEARNLVDAPAGRFALTGTAEGLPVRAGAAFDTAGGGVALDDLGLSAGNLDLSGALTVAADGTARGALAGTVEDLGQLSALAGQDLAGQADLSVTLAAPDGRQRVEASATARDLRYGDGFRVGRATLEATVADALTTPDIDARLTASGVAAAGQSFGTVILDADGTPERLAVDVDIDGDATALTAAATVARDGDVTRVALDTLRGRYAGEGFRLARPATVALGPDGVAVDDLRLALRQGGIRLDGRYGDDLDLTLAVDDLPLSLAGLVVPELGIDGTLDGQATLGGTMTAPDGRFGFRAADVRLAEAQAAGIAPFAVTLDGTWRDGRLAADAALEIPQGGRLDVQAAMPLAADGGIPVVPEGAPVDVVADGRFDLALLNPLLSAGADEVRGTAVVDLDLGGTVDALTGRGTVTLTGGSYRNVLNGTEITGIEAVLTGTGDRLTLTRLTGRTPGGGTLGGSGTLALDPDAGFPVDFRLRLDRAQLVDSNLVTARSSADLQLVGALFRDSLLRGTITVDQAEIRIPETLPTSVASIEVTEVNAPPEIEARLQREAIGRGDAGGDLGQGPNVALDVAVRAPGQVYVRGRGLEAELGGSLAVTGSTAAPVVQGGLELRRGELSLLGNDFAFDHGRVTLTGEGKIDPALDFLASSDVGDVTAQIAVTGRASSPEIAISSTPSLPEDEVLARILFGKATGELSALEAVQLAQSVAQLTGVSGGPGLLGRVRGAAGLDRLNVETGADGQSAVEAGRYVNDQVFIGVEQGLQGGESKAKVEIELTPNIKLESDIGGRSGGSAGVTFEWEY